MSKRIALLAVAVSVVAGLAVSAATASPKKHATKQSSHLLVGINDEAFSLYGDPNFAFSTLKALNTQVLRVNLYWGGTKWAVANKTRPTDPNDPGDAAYDWTIYDRLVRYATQTTSRSSSRSSSRPAGRTAARRGRFRRPTTTISPTSPTQPRSATAGSGRRRRGSRIRRNPTTKLPLPKVTMWTAWNEPNNPIWLTPQYKKVGKKWRVESAFNYAKICNAVYNGVHSPFLGPLPDEHVACGVTGPKGNDAPGTKRSSVDPITFLTQAHRFGMKTFDVYAHHPYPDKGAAESPTFVPKGNFKLRVQLGNINTLLKLISKFYGPKHLWITEFGYQSNPPDKAFGVSLAKQAQDLTQSYAIARKNPRIDMLLWFLVRDEANVKSGWQSGLETPTGKKKPAWAAFLEVPRGT